MVARIFLEGQRLSNSFVQWKRRWVLFSLFSVFVVLCLLLENTQEPATAIYIDRLSSAQSLLVELQRRNRQLLKILRDFEKIDITIDKEGTLHDLEERLEILSSSNGSKVPLKRPSTEYQHLQRHIKNNINEFWYFVKAQLQKMKSEAAESLKPTLDDILAMALDHTQALLSDIDEVMQKDGYKDWRRAERDDLAGLVWRRFNYLQNPQNCKTAKKLICHVEQDCSYGCQIHRLVSCFIVGYGTQRTVILKFEGFEGVFKPLSETCTTNYDSADIWPGKETSQVISIPNVQSMNPRSQYAPQAVPEDLAPRLTRLHGNPIVWWVGHVLQYVLRYQNNTTDYIEATMRSLKLKNPIVGVQLAKTGSGDLSLTLDEHMWEVERYYNQLELKQIVTKRRIYVAADDVQVISDLTKRYPDYQVIFHTKRTETSSGLLNFIIDLHILSLTDFLVCSFSSETCRLAYELMQTKQPDASAKCRSLDDVYFYSQQLHNMRKAIRVHQSESEEEIDLELNDLIDLWRNNWDGYSLGRNLRTNRWGLFPSHKVEIEIETVKFPTYSEIEYTI
uniref:Alpha-(1,6)-fucosyltransferase n=1 Tax=Photinus pyralis TaxID=7054 RepID=A0A1Y1MQD9_PHOPY